MLSPALHQLAESAQALGQLFGLSTHQCNLCVLVLLALIAATIVVLVRHRRPRY